MNYFKYVVNGYIESISKGNIEGNITEEEYNEILESIKNKPKVIDEEHDYRLTTDLEWEPYNPYE